MLPIIRFSSCFLQFCHKLHQIENETFSNCFVDKMLKYLHSETLRCICITLLQVKWKFMQNMKRKSKIHINGTRQWKFFNANSMKRIRWKIHWHCNQRRFLSSIGRVHGKWRIMAFHVENIKLRRLNYIGNWYVEKLMFSL